MDEQNTEFIAATLFRLQKQQDAMQRMFAAVESGIADLAAPERSAGVERLLSAIESGITDMVAAMEGRKDDALDRVAAAIAGLKPEVTVNVPPAKPAVVNVQVQPTPIKFEALMPAAAPPVIHLIERESALRKWRITIPGSGYNAPARVMTIEQLE